MTKGGRKSNEKLHNLQAPGRDFPQEMTSAFHSLHPSSINPRLGQPHHETSPIFLGPSLSPLSSTVITAFSSPPFPAITAFRAVKPSSRVFLPPQLDRLYLPPSFAVPSIYLTPARLTVLILGFACSAWCPFP